MLLSSDSQTTSHLRAISGIRRMCRSRTLCTAGVAFLLIGFGFSRPAQARERGAIGGALNAGLGGYPQGLAYTAGASGWYCLLPALAIGANVGSTLAFGGGEQHGTELIRDFSFEGFVEGREDPSGIVDFFGRVSIGVAHVTQLPPSTGPLYDEVSNEPILELEGGPELRLFLAPPTTRARPQVLLRACATLSIMPAGTFLGLGLSLGFEG